MKAKYMDKSTKDSIILGALISASAVGGVLLFFFLFISGGVIADILFSGAMRKLTANLTMGDVFGYSLLFGILTAAILSSIALPNMIKDYRLKTKPKIAGVVFYLGWLISMAFSWFASIVFFTAIAQISDSPILIIFSIVLPFLPVISGLLIIGFLIGPLILLLVSENSGITFNAIRKRAVFLSIFSGVLAMAFYFFPERVEYAPMEGVSAIGWNGEYFLIGTFDGKLIKFDGENFYRIGNVENRILEIENTKDFWLINAWQALWKYDNTTLEKVTKGDAEKIACNQNYCLAYASMENQEKQLFRYDGISTMPIDITGAVREMHWNGKEWAILAGSNFYIYDDSPIKSAEYKDLKLVKIAENIISAAWDGKSWIALNLLEIKNKTYPSLLFKNEETTELRMLPEYILEGTDSPARPMYILYPLKIACNREYCFISLANNRIIKYAGNFEVVNSTVEGLPTHTLEKVEWNGKYWLISYNIANEGGSLARYDGTNFVEFIPPSSNCFIGGMKWNGEYWLIGTLKFYCNQWALMKYDGKSFNELTENFKDALKE